MGGFKTFAKLVLSILLDIFDFFARIPGVGTAIDVALTFVAVSLWGPIGLSYIWEIIEFTDQIDGFVPTLTLVALLNISS